MTKYIDYTGIRDEERRRGKRAEEESRGGHMLSGWISREGKEEGKKKITHKHTCRSVCHL